MAQALTLTFGKFAVLLGDGANPENFNAPCGFTERSLEIKAETATTQVPDCDDGDLPAWNDTGVKALSASISGQGVLAMESHAIWQAWVLSGQDKNVRVLLNQPNANGGGYYQGAAVCTSLKLDGSFGEKVKQTVAIESDGEWIWVPAVA